MLPAEITGGERGIRTLDTGLPYTHFPGVRLQPLGHLSEEKNVYIYYFSQLEKKNRVVYTLDLEHFSHQKDLIPLG